MRNHVFFFVAVLLLPPSSWAEEQPGTGKIIWSVSTDQNINSMEHFTMDFRNRANRKREYASFAHDELFSSKKIDFTNATEKGGVVILTVPAGEWEFYTFDVSLVTLRGNTNFCPKENFSIPLMVRPGEAIYIGNYYAKRKEGRSLLGLKIITSAFF